MADAAFNFDTNIEAVVRRVRTGLQEIGRTVAQQASAAGASPAQTSALEQGLSQSIQRANRQLTQARREYENVIEGPGGAGSARPNDRAFKAEAEAILRQLQQRLVGDFREIGRAANLPKSQVDQAILQGTATISAGFKEMYSQAAERLRIMARTAGGTPADLKTLLGAGGIDPTKGLGRSGIDLPALRQEIAVQTPRAKPNVQDLRQADMDLGLRDVQNQFKNRLRGGLTATTAPDEAAQIINAALKEATQTWANRVKQVNRRTAASGGPEAGFPTQGVDPGLRQLYGYANRLREARGVTDQPGFTPSQILPQGVGGTELRAELAHLTGASRSAAQANTEEARASLEAAKADRQAAVARSKATAGMTPEEVARARADDRRASLGAYLERRAGVPGSGVSATSPGFIVQGPGQTGRVYQASRRALGEGSLIDSEGRAQTLARRVSPEREQRLLSEFYEKERVARERQLGERQKLHDQGSARLAATEQAERRAAAESLDAQRQYHLGLRSRPIGWGRGSGRVSAAVWLVRLKPCASSRLRRSTGAWPAVSSRVRPATSAATSSWTRRLAALFRSSTARPRSWKARSAPAR